MKNTIKTVCLSIGLVTASLSVNAGVIGIFGSNTVQASAAADALGHTSEIISDFSDLSSYDVVWGLNGSNSGHLSQLTNFSAAFENYVLGGGVFMYHDRRVTGAESVVAGADNFNFVRNPNSSIDLAQPNPVAGAVINDATLDGGNFSNHGYVEELSIDKAYTAIFDNGVDGRLVDFSYEFGAGDVYYSSIPLDHYLGGPTAFSTIYASQAISYAFDLALSSAAPVSEPASIALFALGLFGLSASRLRRKA